MMTTMTTIIALMPVMLSTGTGSEIMKPMASPTVGGLITATLSNLILVPVLYCWIKEIQFKKNASLTGGDKMRMGTIKKMAKSLELKISPEMKKPEVIKAMQRKEGNFDCFGTAISYCDQEKCLFREDCLVPSK